MKKIFAVIILLCMAGITLSCSSRYRSIKTTPPENNPTYKVHHLFDHEGVRVYRFYDDGRYVYFTTPSGIISSHTDDSTRTVTRTLITE